MSIELMIIPKSFGSIRNDVDEGGANEEVKGVSYLT
jgi:hypothetical protein